MDEVTPDAAKDAPPEEPLAMAAPAQNGAEAPAATPGAPGGAEPAAGPADAATPEAAPETTVGTAFETGSEATPEPPPDALPEAAGSRPAAPAPAPAAEVTEEQLRLAEALIFAASEPVPPRALVQALPDGSDADAVLVALVARYAGRGVELTQSAGGWQFRTAPDLAQALIRVIPQPRRLPRAAMETLAIIAYHQPVTRAEIEEIRGASVSQATLDALLEAGLVGPRGRRETPGRPALWGTTANFLAQFQLQSLRDLPRREELLVETPNASNAAVASAPPSEEAPVGEPTAEQPGGETPGEVAEAAQDGEEAAPSVGAAPETESEAEAPRAEPAQQERHGKEAGS